MVTMPRWWLLGIGITMLISGFAILSPLWLIPSLATPSAVDSLNMAAKAAWFFGVGFIVIFILDSIQLH
jgi:hypothetical protein